jgi:hypothetical protein
MTTKPNAGLERHPADLIIEMAGTPESQVFQAPS